MVSLFRIIGRGILFLILEVLPAYTCRYNSLVLKELRIFPVNKLNITNQFTAVFFFMTIFCYFAVLKNINLVTPGSCM